MYPHNPATYDQMMEALAAQALRDDTVNAILEAAGFQVRPVREAQNGLPALSFTLVDGNYHVDYQDLEAVVKWFYPVDNNLSFVAERQSSNDSHEWYRPGDDWSDHSRMITDWLDNGAKQPRCTVFLEELVDLGIIPGDYDYYVNVSW